MATSIDHLSGLGAGLRIGPTIGTFPAQKKKRPPVVANPEEIREGGLFHQSLILSGGAVRSRNLWAAAGSLSLQLLLLAAAVVIPLLHTDVLPKKETLTALYFQPPAAAPIGTSLRTPTPVSTHSPTSSAISAPVKKAQEAPPTPAGTAGGVLGGVPGGVVGGVPGGILGEVLGSARGVPALAKTPAPGPVKRVHLAQRIVEANLIQDVTPTYPPEAGRARIEGMVVLLAVIGKDGRVQDVRVESGLPILAQAAIDAVKQWRYRPYLLNGEPVEVDSRITINFALSRG